MNIHTPDMIEGLRSFAATNGEEASYSIGNLPPVDFYVADFGTNRPLNQAVAAAFTEIGKDQHGIIVVDTTVADKLQGLWALH